MRLATTIMLAVLLTVRAAAPAEAQPAAAPSVYGVWWNNHQNVKVQTKPCGALLCGTVVWANAGAVHDAKVKGTDPLLGIELLKGYKETRPGEWRGEVFVPDMDRTFSSRIDQVAADRLKISGCILGGLVCKSQIWTRV